MPQQLTATINRTGHRSGKKETDLFLKVIASYRYPSGDLKFQVATLSGLAAKVTLLKIPFNCRFCPEVFSWQDN